MITILHRGGGSLGTPESDYVICARPLTHVLGMWTETKNVSRIIYFTWTYERLSELEVFLRKSILKKKIAFEQMALKVTKEDRKMPPMGAS